MLNSMQPNLTIPPPLHGDELGSFAHNTITRRLPEIGRRTLAENDFPPGIAAEIKALIDSMPHGKVRHIADILAPDQVAWETYVKPYLGLNWLEIPWFFAEHYFYRRMIEATGYFKEGWGQGYDPYALQKRQGLEAGLEDIRELSSVINGSFRHGQWSQPELEALIIAALWGNQADLSLWPAEPADNKRVELANKPNHKGSAMRHILINHLPQTVVYFTSKQNRGLRVDFLIDNAGFEFFSDLCLADFLLGSEIAHEVHLHLKPHPTFVSDAMVRDLNETIDFLARDDQPDTQELATRWQAYRERGSFVARSDFFWTSPLSMWEMPLSLREDLGGSGLVISKGDANFRRLVGDRHWPNTALFEDILNYFPAPLLALRALKSEVMAGLEPDRIMALFAEDSDWMINGRWGMILMQSR